MRTKPRVVIFLALLVSWIGSPRASAQTVTGTLSGHAVDASGAVMPGLKIQARNEQTDLLREAVTNSEGYYLVSFLPLGSYQVTVAAAGFQTITKTGVLIGGSDPRADGCAMGF